MNRLSWYTKEGLRWLGCDHAAIRLGMFTRHGGMSEAPFDSLNLSHGVGDDPGRVDGNRQRLCTVLGIEILVSAVQIHSDRVHLVAGEPGEPEIRETDALITNRPGVGLLIQQADCQAVLLHDPEHRAIGAVHCGWRGSVCNIIARTIARMRESFATDPGRLLAYISPSLGPCCSQFVNHARELPASFAPFRMGRDHFNFWEISRWQLQQCGVPQTHIEIAGICTRCTRDFFSFRRTGGTTGCTGRNGSVIMLVP